MNCGANSCPPIGVYSSDELEDELNTAMTSFGESHVTIDSSNENVLILHISQIMRWYRKDFYKSTIGLAGIVYVSLRKGDEPESADVFLKFCDEQNQVPTQMPLDGDGLMKWDVAFFEGLLRLKKGKKLKVQWKDYDWGTNSK